MNSTPVAALLVICSVSAIIAQEPKPSFEVASIRVNRSGQNFGYYGPTPGRFTATSMNVVELVSLAYRVPMTRIIVPDRVPEERYDINATIPSSSKPGNYQDGLQRLLEDRFALRVHRETRDLPIYVLVRSRPDGTLGPHLVPMDVCTDAPKGGPPCGGMQFPGPGALVARRTWSSLGPFLSDYFGRSVNRVVVDKTGLTGWFDFKLEWSLQTIGAPSVDGLVDSRPSLFAAFEEQLGLKLESTRGPVEVLVIDSVQQPPGN